MGKTVRSIILGGLFFIIPLLLLIIVFKKAMALIAPLIHGLASYFNIHTIFGTATITILSVAVLLFFCYLSGLLLKIGLVNDWNSKLEDKLFLLFPGLISLKYRLMPEEKLANNTHWKAILLNDDKQYNIAFITQKDEDGYLSIYVPDAPRMDAGELRFIHEKDCQYVNITMRWAMRSLNSFGRDEQVGKAVKDTAV